MVKTENIIIKETLYVFVCMLILSLVMQAVFIFVNSWDYTVITGNLLGILIMTTNFYLMGIGVKKAVAADEKEAKKILKISQSLRLLLILVVLVIGVALPYFSTLATIIPVIFPRIAVALRPVWDKINKKGV